MRRVERVDEVTVIMDASEIKEYIDTLTRAAKIIARFDADLSDDDRGTSIQLSNLGLSLGTTLGE